MTADGERVDYDALVLATGSYAFVPPVPGRDLPPCHVYRTLDDLDAIRADAERARRASHTPVGVVIGGGLLGLEAANALRSFGLHAHVVEMAPRLMAQQLDEAGGALLSRMIGDLGITVHTGVGTEGIQPAQRNRPVRRSAEDEAVRVTLSDGTVDRRRRGHLRRGRAPARRAGPRRRAGSSPSVAVCSPISPAPQRIAASMRSARSPRSKVAATAWSGPATPAPKSSPTGCSAAPRSSPRPTCRPSSNCSASTSRVSATRWASRRTASRSPSTTRSTRPTPNWCSPTTPRRCSAESWSATRRRTASCGRWSASRCPAIRWRLIAPAGSDGGSAGLGVGALPDGAQICSCNNVTKGDLTDAIAGGCCDVPALKKCTLAGTSCGSCVPLLKQLLEAEGVEQSKALCEHFSQSRAELYEIICSDVDQDLLGADRTLRHRKGLRHMQTRRRLDPGFHELRAHPRRRAGLAAGQQRPLPRQYPAQRQLLGRAAGARRRHHARASDPDR